MKLISSMPGDFRAYFTWYNAAALAFALIGGAFMFIVYFTREYDGDKIMPGWEWRRGTGHGVYAGKATIADVYGHNNKGKSYRKAWKRRGVILCFLGALLIVFCGGILPMALLKPSAGVVFAWAEPYEILAGGTPHPHIIQELLASPLFRPKFLAALLAVIPGLRLPYGILRLIRLRKRQKSNLIRDSLSRTERACMGLSRADCIIGIVGILACVYPIFRAARCVFGPNVTEAAVLPEDYYNGLLLCWQAGVTLVVMLWTVVERVMRAVKTFNNPG